MKNNKKEIIKKSNKFIFEYIVKPAILTYGIKALKEGFLKCFIHEINSTFNKNDNSVYEFINKNCNNNDIIFYEDFDNYNYITSNNKSIIKFSNKFNIFIIIKPTRKELIVGNNLSYLDEVYIKLIGTKRNCKIFKDLLLKQKENNKNIIFKTQYKDFVDFINKSEIPNIEKDLYVSRYKEDIFNKIKNHIDIYSSENDNINFSKGLTFLLYGKPGTGKTSIGNSILINFKNKIDRVAYLDDDEFIEEITSEFIPFFKSDKIENFRFIILDEIDLCLYSKNDDKINNSLLKRILRCLDILPPNYIVIMTTNNIDKLPDSLKRDGRCDFKYKITDFNKQEIQEYLSKRNILKEDIENNIKDENGNSIVIGDTINPAYLNKICNLYEQDKRNGKI